MIAYVSKQNCKYNEFITKLEIWGKARTPRYTEHPAQNDR